MKSARVIVTEGDPETDWYSVVLTKDIPVRLGEDGAYYEFGEKAIASKKFRGTYFIPNGKFEIVSEFSSLFCRKTDDDIVDELIIKKNSELLNKLNSKTSFKTPEERHETSKYILEKIAYKPDTFERMGKLLEEMQELIHSMNEYKDTLVIENNAKKIDPDVNFENIKSHYKRRMFDEMADVAIVMHTLATFEGGQLDQVISKKLEEIINNRTYVKGEKVNESANNS